LMTKLPRASGEGTVEVELSGAERTGSTRLSGQWQGAWPSGPLGLVPNQIVFSWKRPRCIYPAGSCPAVTLEGGVECSATPTEEGCRYLCPGEKSQGEPAVVCCRFHDRSFQPSAF